MISKLAISLLCFFLAGTSAGQSENILKLKKKPYYSERNHYSSDSSVALIQEVCYNKPKTVDEEYCVILKLQFIDPLKAKELKTLTIGKDSSIVQCSFDFQSVWNWEDEKTSISGSIQLLDWTKTAVKLRLDLQILDHSRKKIYSYEGIRSFKRKSGK